MFASEQTAAEPRFIMPDAVVSTVARHLDREKNMTRLDFIARRMAGCGAARRAATPLARQEGAVGHDAGR